MTTRRSPQTPAGRLAILTAGAALALLVIGATWHLIQGSSALAHASVPDGPSLIHAAEGQTVELSEPIATPSLGDERVAAPMATPVDDDSQLEPLESTPSLIGLEGRLTHSRLGPAFDLSSIKALAAVVSIHREKQYLTIPVTQGRFRLEYVEQEDGSLALENGSRKLSHAALNEIGSASIELIAPTLNNSASTLRFLDPSDPTSPPKRRISAPFGRLDLTLTLQAPPIVRLWVTDGVSGTSLEGVDVYLASQAHREFHGEIVFKGKAIRMPRLSPIAKQLASGGAISLPDNQSGTESVQLDVKVAGYAPGTIAANFRDGDDLHLALPRAGSVIVEVIGGPMSEGRVALRTADGVERNGSWTANKPVNRLEEVRFDSVPPGPILVGVEGALNEPEAAPEKGLLDMREVVVKSGGTTRVRLRAVSNALPRARVAGWILLPDAWGEFSTLDLQLVPRQGQVAQPIECVALPPAGGAALPAEIPSGHRAFGFDAREVPVGSYTLRLKSPLHDTQIVVPPKGATRLKVRVRERRRFDTLPRGTDLEEILLPR